jgi:hypothetical protein
LQNEPPAERRALGYLTPLRMNRPGAELRGIKPDFRMNTMQKIPIIRHPFAVCKAMSTG